MDKKPLVLLPPLSTALMELREILQENDQVEVYEATNIDEADQLFGVLKGALWLASSPKAAIDFMTSRGSEVKSQQSKFVLVAANKVINDYMEQLKKCHIQETIDEQIPIKTLQYKINLLIKALPIPHVEMMDEQATKILKKEETIPIIEKAPKLHLEKLIKGSENVASLFGNSNEMDDNKLENLSSPKKKSILILDKKKSTRKIRLLSSIVDSNDGLLNDKTSNPISSDGVIPSLALKRKKEKTKLDIESDSEQKKIVTLNLNTDDNENENENEADILSLINKKEDLIPLKKKTVELTLEESQAKENISSSQRQDDELPTKEKVKLKLEKSPEDEDMASPLPIDDGPHKKEKIKLDIEAEQEKERSPAFFLEKNPDKEKAKLLLDSSPDNNKQPASLTLETTPKDETTKTPLVFEISSLFLPNQEETKVALPLEESSENKSIDLSILSSHQEDDILEKYIDDTLQNELSKDKNLSQTDLSHLPANSFFLELSIDLLHKQKSPHILLRSLAIILLKKHKGLTSYLMYDKITKCFSDLWIGHFEILNTENDETKNALIQKRWDAYKNKNSLLWINLTGPMWRDHTFQQNKQELFMPITSSESNDLIGIVIIQFNKQVYRDQAQVIQTLSFMSSWVFLEIYKNTKKSDYKVNFGKMSNIYSEALPLGLWALILSQIKKLFYNKKIIS